MINKPALTTPDDMVKAMRDGFFNVIELTAQRVEQDGEGLPIPAVFQALLDTYVGVVESVITANPEDAAKYPVRIAIEIDTGALFLVQTATEYLRSLLESDVISLETQKTFTDFRAERARIFRAALSGEDLKGPQEGVE